MTITVSNTTSSQSFGSWLTKTNQMAQIMSSNALTADSTATGSVTTGNAVVNGFFSANTLVVTNNIRGGNLTTSNTITISSNVSIASGNILNIGSTHINSNSHTFVNLTVQTIDTFAIATYRSVEYTVQLANTTKFQVSKILGIHDGTVANITEYGIINDGTSIGTFSATISSGNFLLQCQPTSNTITAKIFRSVTTV